MQRAILISVTAIVSLFLLAVAERIAYADRVLPGVEVEGVSVSGSGEESAFNEVSALAAELESEPIVARAGDIQLAFAPGEVDFDIDEEATLRAARTAGRSANPIEQTTGAMLRRIRSETQPLVMTWDDAKVDGIVDQWFNTLGEGVVDGDLEFDGTTVVEVPPQAGRGIDTRATKADVIEQLGSPTRDPIQLELVDVEPRITAQAVSEAAERARELLSADIVVIANDNFLVLTPEGLASALTTKAMGDALTLDIDQDLLVEALGEDFLRLIVEPVDAGFSVDGNVVSVVPHVNGNSPDLDALIEAILAGERRIETPVVVVEPERTTQWAESMNITGLVSSFTTSYPAGQPRVQNIQRGAQLIDGTVVPPGEIFSFNEVVGPRTTERGFVDAPVFYGEFTEDVGGGVSQLATTVFNAVFYGGYEDVTHKPHSLYFSRYPRVIEATVNYGTVDLQFRNDTEAGVLIRAYAGDSSVTVNFYGDNGGRIVSLEGPTVLEEFPVEDEFTDWPLLPEGVEELVERGIPGFSAEAFRIIEEPGKDPVRERFFWRYRMLPNQILRGTATPETTVDPSSTSDPDASSSSVEPTTTQPGATTSSPATTTPPATQGATTTVAGPTTLPENPPEP